MHVCVLCPFKNATQRRCISFIQIKMFVWDICLRDMKGQVSLCSLSAKPSLLNYRIFMDGARKCSHLNSGSLLRNQGWVRPGVNHT